MRRDFEVCALGPVKIRNEIVRDIGIFSRILGIVHLPEVLQARRVVHGLPCFRLAALVCTVVHDGYARMERIDDDFGIRLIEAVMRSEV